MTPGPIHILLRLLCIAPLALMPALVHLILTRSPLAGKPKEGYDRLAASMEAGQPVWTTSDPRGLRLAQIRALRQRPDMFVLGGSRTLAVAEEWFGGKKVLNLAVPAGGADDSIAIFESSIAADRVPSSIILEVFPALVRDSTPGNLLATWSYLGQARSRLGVPHLPALAVFSPSDILPDFNLTLSGISGGSGCRKGMLCFQPDGHATWLAAASRFNPVSTEGVLDFIDRLPPSEVTMRSKSEPDPITAILFRRFLDDLRVRGVSVYALLAPVHPVAWDYFRERGGYREDWLRREFGLRSIPVLGTYQPSAVGAGPADFVDAIHPKAHVLHGILARAGLVSR